MEYSWQHTPTLQKNAQQALDAYLPILRSLGQTLAMLNLIPIIQDQKQPNQFRTSGNFGIKLSTLPGFLVTGTEVDKATLSPQDVVYIEWVDHNDGIIYGYGHVPPSREILIHEHIYRSLPYIQTVIHTHDNLLLQHGSIPTTSQVCFAATPQVSTEIVELLTEVACINMKQHGQIIIGRNHHEALQTLIDTHARALENFRSSFVSQNPLPKIGRG